MSKIVDQPILVVVEKGRPKRFFWIKRWINISFIIDKWNEVGRWWENEEEKVFFRVLTFEGSMYEIYSSKKRWSLYRVYD